MSARSEETFKGRGRHQGCRATAFILPVCEPGSEGFSGRGTVVALNYHLRKTGHRYWSASLPAQPRPFSTCC